MKPSAPRATAIAQPGGPLAQADANGSHYPWTYLTGGYNRVRTKIAGRVEENEDLVNVPNWLTLAFRIDKGDWFDLNKADLLRYRQTLDLKRGLLKRSIRFRDPAGREISVEERGIVLMAEPYQAALEITLWPKSGPGPHRKIRSGRSGGQWRGGALPGFEQ